MFVYGKNFNDILSLKDEDVTDAEEAFQEVDLAKAFKNAVEDKIVDIALGSSSKDHEDERYKNKRLNLIAIVTASGKIYARSKNLHPLMSF